jgi:hypothetical protein
VTVLVRDIDPVDWNGKDPFSFSAEGDEVYAAFDAAAAMARLRG